MNVLIYSGPEVLQVSLKGTLSSLRSILIPHYTVQTISRESLASQPWSSSCALLVFPGCYDLSPFPSTPIVRNYVESGGALLALSTGGTLSSSTGLDLSSLSISGLSKNQSLRFFDKVTETYLYPQFHSGGDVTTSSDVLKMVSGDVVEHIQQIGSTVLTGVDEAKNARGLARFGEKVVAVRCDLSKGKAAVWAAGIELPLATSVSTVWETKRRSVLQDTLRELGLHIPSEDQIATSYPLPQFLIAPPSKARIVNQVIDALARSPNATSLTTFEDKNDKLQFHDFHDSDKILQEARSRSNRDIEPDPTSWQPKHVIVCRDGALPSNRQTPLFDVGLFFDELIAARKAIGFPEDSKSWGMGEALLYGEAVTSTQTMIDK